MKSMHLSNYLIKAMTLSSLWFATTLGSMPVHAQVSGPAPVTVEGNVPLGKPIVNGKTQGEDETPKNPNECQFQLSDDPVALFVGGQFVAGEGLEKHKRFDAFLSGQFHMKHRYVIEAQKDMTSKLFAENLNTILSNYRPEILVIDTAMADLQLGLERQDSFMNLQKILKEVTRYKLEVILVEGPARAEIAAEQPADPMYAVLASQYNVKLVTGVYTNLSNSLSYVNKFTPAVESQFHFAKSYVELMKKCYPQSQNGKPN